MSTTSARDLNMTQSAFPQDVSTTAYITYDYKDEPEYRAVEILLLYFGPVTLVVGTVGNVLAGVVVVRSKLLWKRTFSLYILMLAVADTLMMIFGLLDYVLFMYGIDVRTYTNESCKMVIFLKYYLSMWEAWILVNMSLERLVAVYLPLRCRSLFTKERAGIGLIITTVLPLGINAIYLPVMTRTEYTIYGSTVGECDTKDEWVELFGIFDWVALAIVSVIPFLIMVICSLLIVGRIMYTNVQRRRMQVTSNIKVSSMTFAMLAVALAFLILTGPTAALYPMVNMFYADDSKTVHEANKLYNVTLIMNFFWYWNYVINFYIYCVSNSKFRSEAVNVLCCRQRKTTTSRLTSISNISGYRRSTTNSEQGTTATSI